MIGITSVNGYPLPMDERFAKIRAAGFDSLLLWWGNDEAESRRERVTLAAGCGLRVENVHGTTDRLNALWMDDAAGDGTLTELMREISDCADCGIGTIVLHLTNGSVPPPVSAVGLSRIESLIRLAEHACVRLAFENVRKQDHLLRVLETYPSPYVGLCYDSGHEHFWSSDMDWLAEYGHRVFAVHLHDNCGEADSHLLPFDGTIDWNKKARQLAASAYTGALTVESEIHASDRYAAIGLDSFLAHAHARGERLAALIRSYKS